MESQEKKDIEPQIAALERAVKLLPMMGRVYAELARVYALNGQAEKSLPLVAKALELEPEFAYRFYEIRADANVALGKFDHAHTDIQIANILPHPNKDEAERISLKVMGIRKRIETIRREADDRRYQELRRQVDAEVARKEPPPKPAPPPPPVPEGMITYQIEARSVIEVVDAVFPEYPEALRQAKATGNVTLQVTVGANGKVTAATVTNSQVPALNTATIEAVKKWSFKPGGRSLKLIISYTLP